jgi:hypothetical protein
MSGRRTRAGSQDAANGIVFESFGADPLAVEPHGVTRMSTSPACFTRSAVHAAQVSDVRGRSLLPGSVDEEMTGVLPAHQVHAADQSSELPHSTTAQDADGRVDEGNLGGTIPPRATGGRDLSAEGGIGVATTAHDAERRVAFTSTTVQRSSGEEEAELRARI